MKFSAILWLSFILILTSGSRESESITWDKLITSKSYENTRLVMETENPFQSLYVSKETSAVTTQIICSKFCANNATCLGFNFYSTSNQYVCEYLPENFCSNRQRIALQSWPRGTVIDKLSPGMTKACIDQHFGNSTINNYCRISRPGCGNWNNSSLIAWPGCDNCVKTCVDCTILNNITDRVLHNCTLWPDGPFEPPIFAFCLGTATYLFKRYINTRTGHVWPNYRMRLTDVHRVSRLMAYKTIAFYFAGKNKSYFKKYDKFSIDKNSFLANLSTNSAKGDAFKVLNTIPKPFPWVEVNSKCGSFWYLNSTRTSATMQCPGGGISMFGHINLKVTPKETGIHWPDASKDKVILYRTDTKIDIS